MSNSQVTVNRNKYVGGSDLPNILGLNEVKYGESLFQFAKKKMGIIPNDFQGNPYTKYGQLIEPIIRDHMNATNGTNYIEDSLSDEVRLLRGNTDGIDRDTDSIPMIEIKSFGKELDVDYYQYQCQFYMEMYDQPAIALVGYPRPEGFYTGIDYDLENDDHFFDLSFDPKNLVMHVIERDPALWERMYRRITAFQLACIELKKNPDMTLDEWNTLFYGAEMVKRQQAVIALENQMIEFKAIEKKHKEAKQKLLDQFVEHGVKTLDTGKVRITHVLSADSVKTVLDEAGLKKKHPKIYQEFFSKKKTTKGKSYLLVNVKEIGGDTA